MLARRGPAPARAALRHGPRGDRRLRGLRGPRGGAQDGPGHHDDDHGPGHGGGRRRAPTPAGAVVSSGAAAGGEDDLWTGEFCCLFYGFRTRCLACPLPKAVQDLFEDGTLNATRFRGFGRRASWQGFAEDGAHAAAREHRGSRAHYEECLGVLGFAEKGPKKLREIKFAYRKRAKELHPDVGGDDVAFRELVAAYESAKALFMTYSKQL